MNPLPLRLTPGQDLRDALLHALAGHGAGAAFVLQGIGSQSVARIRCAGQRDALELRGDREILTLAGTLSPDGPHLHISVADAQGNVLGGHVEPGCLVRTTAEILLALLPGHRFSRPFDAATGFKELLIEPGS
jgi:uncharacterized protein